MHCTLTETEQTRTFKPQLLDTSVDVHHPISFLHRRRGINCKRLDWTDDVPAVTQLCAHSYSSSHSTRCAQQLITSHTNSIDGHTNLHNTVQRVSIVTYTRLTAICPGLPG